MKELDFKEMVVDSCKNYLSEHLDDEEIYRKILTCSSDALDSILGLNFDFFAIQKVLTFYLLNSKDCEEIKQRNAYCIGLFVDAAQIILKYNIELGVLNKVLFEITNKQDSHVR